MSSRVTTKRSKEDYEALILSKLQPGLAFVKWDFKDNIVKYTRSQSVILCCEVHGELPPKTVTSILQYSRGCVLCGHIRTGESRKQDAITFREQCLSTGKFHEDTKFERYSGKNWTVTCGGCSYSYISEGSNLKRGTVGCGCLAIDTNCQFAYILNISKTDSSILKFGITNNPKRRFLEISSALVEYRVTAKMVWVFENSVSCRIAEKEVKSSLQTCVVDREVMGDGWTETCYPLQLDEIIKIYEDLGGVRTIL